MAKVEYIDRVVDDLNALQIEFHGIPLSFNREIVMAGAKELGTEREQLVFSLYCKNYSLRKVGEEIGVSTERVRQILKKLERKLKAHWAQYYKISLADADNIIRLEVNQQIAKYISENQPETETSKPGYSFNDFAVNANLSVRTYNCIRRAGINSVEELIEKTPDEIISLRNLGRKSYEELEAALQQIGLKFREEPIDKSAEVKKEEKQKVEIVGKNHAQFRQLDHDKLVFLKSLDQAFRISITTRMKEEIKNFDPLKEYGGKEENLEIQRSWHEHVLMRNVLLGINDMLNHNATEEEMIRLVKYAFVAFKAVDYGLDYERAETDFRIPELYKKYIKADA